MLEIDRLRRSNDDLHRRLAEAEQALFALAHGEVDAVALDTSTSPILLHAAQQQLRSSQQLFRSVFDCSLDAITLADAHGNYVDANAAATRLFGVAHGELIGRHYSEFIPTDLDGPARFHRFIIDGSRSGQFALRIRDGAHRIIDFSAVANVTPGLHLCVLRDITDRVAAEDSLRRNEALFRAVIEKSAEVISLTSADGNTRYLTPSAWRLLGWHPDEMVGRTLRDQVIPEDRDRIGSELARLVRTGERDMAMNLRVAHRDGSIRWVESTATNLLHDPDVRAIVGNYRDITARKHAEDALRASRDELEVAQAIAHVGSWTSGVGMDGIVEWSRECYRIYGIPEGTPITVASYYAYVHPDDRQRMHLATRAALDAGAPAEIEHRIVRPDGEIRHVHQRGVVERDAHGQAVRMFGTLQDVTERLATVEALRESEQRYRRIVENTTEGVWVSDPDGITIFVNARMGKMLGWTVEEIVGRPLYEFVKDSDLPAARERTRRRQQGLSDRDDVHLRRKDGTYLLVSIQANPLFDASGNFEMALCLITDVSAQRGADAVRAHLASIVESSDDSIISATLDGIITSWNLGAAKLYQYSAAEMMGKSMSVLIPEASAVGELDIRRRVARGESVPQYEAQRARKDGSGVEVAVTISPVRSAEGSVIGISQISRDLSARRAAEAAHHRVEEQFRQVQKMEAVGRLAGGVAHDFNNLLSVILSYSDFAIEELKDGDPLRSDIVQIKEAAQRAAELTKQLLAFSRQQVLQPRVVELDRIIDGLKSMLGRLLGEDVELALVTAPALGRVLADPGQIEQVVMNLTINARDAMPDGGKLSIETSNVHLDVGDVGGVSGVQAGDYVLLAVADSGTGMDAETCARVFEPFFTTKPTGKGTGLGLSTVFGIVQQSGGFVDVQSELGQGTTFRAYFPRSHRIADSMTGSGVIPVIRSSETILLVEDEDQVRAVACAILRRNGYHVLESAGGGDALLISKEFAGKIHLLLTDVVMPRMNGRKLSELLLEERPEMQVLFASGYTDDTIVRHGVLEEDVAFIQKPFTPASLLRKVREVLDAPRPALSGLTPGHFRQ